MFYAGIGTVRQKQMNNVKLTVIGAVTWCASFLRLLVNGCTCFQESSSCVIETPPSSDARRVKSDFVRRPAKISCVRPLLEYAVPVWDPHLVKDTRALESVQRFATHAQYHVTEILVRQGFWSGGPKFLGILVRGTINSEIVR